MTCEGQGGLFLVRHHLPRGSGTAPGLCMLWNSSTELYDTAMQIPCAYPLKVGRFGSVTGLVILWVTELKRDPLAPLLWGLDRF